MQNVTYPENLNPDMSGQPSSLAPSTVFENGDLILYFLEKIGVEYIFGIPGGAIEPLYNALGRSQARGGIRPVIARHETGAAFMADGYTRESGILGVCCGTTGPGSTNLLTGVASAYENEIPVLVITAQTALHTFGKGASQESSCTSVNTLGMFQYCTRYNSLVSHAQQLEHKLAAAIVTAHQFPRGPVHLSIPTDVLAAPAELKGYHLDPDNLKIREIPVSPAVISRLVDELNHARKPVFVLGSGAAGFAREVTDLAVLLNATIVTSIDGKGLVSSYHPLFRGVFGFAGHHSAMETLRDPDVDLVIAFGSNLGELATGGWDEKSLLNDRLIHIDPVAAHFIRGPMARLQVIGSIDLVCLHLIEHLSEIQSNKRLPITLGSADPVTDVQRNPFIRPGLPGCSLSEEDKYFDDSSPIKPQRLMNDLGRLFPPSTRFLADIGNSFAWATHYLHPADRRLGNRRSPERPDFLDPGRRKKQNSRVAFASYRSGIEFASMGWAIGAAVGTAFANPNCPVVCITGDGSMLMSGQEITVARTAGLTVIFVVLNDAALGMVKHGQRLAGAKRIGFELPWVDFKKFAESMGIEAYTIHSPDDLANLDIQAVCARKAPTLLDVYIDPEEVPPMGLRVELLRSQRSPNENRTDIEQNLERDSGER
ncbi:MAG: thiamine pyrophosphate-binding protein [Methylococcales bacterium]